MSSTLRILAISAAFSVAASAASALSVSPFSTPLSAGDSTNGSATAVAFENFGMTSLSFTAADALIASVSYIIDPFLTNLGGTPSNSIGLAYSINSGASIGLSIAPLSLGAGNIGVGGVEIDLEASDTLTFIVSGGAGQSGNVVTFNVETTAPPVNTVPVAPAGLLLLTGLGGLIVARKKSRNA